MNKPLKIAAISGIVIIILSFVMGIFSNLMGMTILAQNKSIMSLFSIVFYIFMTVFSILYTFGYIVLAKKFNARLLLVMAWISISFSVLVLTLVMVFNIVGMVGSVNAQNSPSDVNDFNQLNEELGGQFGNSVIIDPMTGELTPQGMTILLGLLVLFVIFCVIFGVYNILFGIGLLKLKNDVELSYASGILNIVAGATFIILIGFIIAIPAMIVEIIMFFKASKKFESSGIKKDEKKKK